MEPEDVTSVLRIGLFDGMGALRVAADAIGLPVAGHISIEKHAPAVGLSKVGLPALRLSKMSP